MPEAKTAPAKPRAKKPSRAEAFVKAERLAGLSDEDLLFMARKQSAAFAEEVEACLSAK